MLIMCAPSQPLPSRLPSTAGPQTSCFINAGTQGPTTPARVCAVRVRQPKPPNFQIIVTKFHASLGRESTAVLRQGTSLAFTLYLQLSCAVKRVFCELSIFQSQGRGEDKMFLKLTLLLDRHRFTKKNTKKKHNSSFCHNHREKLSLTQTLLCGGSIDTPTKIEH